MSFKWWKAKEGAIYNDVFAIVDFLSKHQYYRTATNFQNMRLYGNMDLMGMNVGGYTKDQTPSPQNRIKFNIVASCVDTITSKIGQNRPRPMFLTTAGDWGIQQKAKKLNRFVEGIFDEIQMYPKGIKAFRDAAVFGTGPTFFYKERGKIKAERVFVDELIVDDIEATYGEPRVLHRRKAVSKEVLADLFPKKTSLIETAPPADKGAMRNDALIGLIEVVESWHLPSGEEQEDGKHAITIRSGDLFSEEYEKPYFPFVFQRWTDRLLGFWGQGIAEQLTGKQLEINKILRTIQIAMHLCSVPKWLVDKASKIVSAHINNDVGTILKYSGNPPELKVFNAVPTELIQHLQWLIQSSYEEIGISSLSASSVKPPGLNSGVAMREYSDIQSERFAVIQQGHEQYHLDCAKMCINMGKEIAEEEGDYSTVYKNKKGIETIKWSEISLEDDQYRMQCFPTSMLPRTPAGRLEMVEDLLQAGFIDKEDGIKLLDFPDIESTTNLLIASSELMDKIIEEMIENGQYTSPEPFQNLDAGITKMQMSYLKAKMDGVPEKNLECMRRWIETASKMLGQPTSNNTAPPAEGAPNEAPTGVPASPPTSELLPTNPSIQ